MNSPEGLRNLVQDYYGDVLDTNEDLKTTACCSTETIPEYIRPLLVNVHEKVKEKFYGCGSPIPVLLDGKTVLDLGCGSGQDCYVMSQLVGENGFVIGVDMTDNQLAVANEYIDYHMEKFGYKKRNIEFKKGYIEDLKSLNIENNSIDVVVSNCVLNLSSDKENVFREIFRVLKPGGELYFSDVFTDRRIPEKLANDPIMIGECLGGALYVEDFRRMLNRVGCFDHRFVSKSSLSIKDTVLATKAGMVGFCSITVRAFKCDFEDICEDFGHVAFYQGSIPNFRHEFRLDDHHIFPKGKPVSVCGNTAKMLTETRLADHFKVHGDFSTHYGPFDCGNPIEKETPDSGGCC